LHVLKAFENALESQLKYITGCRAWNNFCVCLDQWCSRERNLWGQDLVKTSRPRLHQKLRDSRLEIWDRDSRRQNLSILPKFWLNVVITSEFNFFYFWHCPTCFGCFLPANTTNKKSLNFGNFTKLFLCNIQSLETCNFRDWDETWNLPDRASQKRVSTLHHWFRHRCTLHLLQRILISPLHVWQWWSRDLVLVSRLPIFRVSVSKVWGLVLVSITSTFGEALSSAKIWLSKTFVN